MELIIS